MPTRVCNPSAYIMSCPYLQWIADWFASLLCKYTVSSVAKLCKFHKSMPSPKPANFNLSCQIKKFLYLKGLLYCHPIEILVKH